MSKRKKIKKKILFLTVFSVLLIYIIYDNSRVMIVYQDIEIANLPESFDGFTILQVTDLHGKWFGENQMKLANIINHTNSDLIAFTGDFYSKSTTEYKKGIQPFYDLLDELTIKTPMYYLSGNTGPFDLINYTDVRTDIGEELEEKGLILLDQVHSITKGKDTLWISEFYLYDNLQAHINKANQQTDSAEYSQNQEKYLLGLQEDLKKIKPEDTLIALTHYPFNSSFYQQANSDVLPNYDLVIAGHYHGGQIRLPFYGALFIPDEASVNHGWFPNQDEVSGLKKTGDYQQYISRGLGASGSIPFLQFRLFNTPEINIIRLVKPK